MIDLYIINMISLALVVVIPIVIVLYVLKKRRQPSMPMMPAISSNNPSEITDAANPSENVEASKWPPWLKKAMIPPTQAPLIETQEVVDLPQTQQTTTSSRLENVILKKIESGELEVRAVFKGQMKLFGEDAKLIIKPKRTKESEQEAEEETEGE